MLRDAITKALRAKTDESPGMKSRVNDAAEAIAAVKQDVAGGLPRMRRAGRTDASDLVVSLSCDALLADGLCGGMRGALSAEPLGLRGPGANLTSSVVARVSTASSSEGGRTFRTATGGCSSVSATTRARGRM